MHKVKLVGRRRVDDVHSEDEDETSVAQGVELTGSEASSEDSDTESESTQSGGEEEALDEASDTKEPNPGTKEATIASEEVASTNSAKEDINSPTEENHLSSNEGENGGLVDKVASNKLLKQPVGAVQILKKSTPSKTSKSDSESAKKDTNASVHDSSSSEDSGLHSEDEDEKQDYNGDIENNGAEKPTSLRKKGLTTQEYRKKLAEDPAFVPRRGEFWGHDDRFTEDGLKNDFDKRRRRPQLPFAPRGGRVVWGNSEPRGRWDHNGFEELMRMEQEEERKRSDSQRRPLPRREFGGQFYAPSHRPDSHNFGPPYANGYATRNGFNPKGGRLRPGPKSSDRGSKWPRNGVQERLQDRDNDQGKIEHHIRRYSDSRKTFNSHNTAFDFEKEKKKGRDGKQIGGPIDSFSNQNNEGGWAPAVNYDPTADGWGKPVNEVEKPEDGWGEPVNNEVDQSEGVWSSQANNRTSKDGWGTGALDIKKQPGNEQNSQTSTKDSKDGWGSAPISKNPENSWDSPVSDAKPTEENNWDVTSELKKLNLSEAKEINKDLGNVLNGGSQNNSTQVESTIEPSVTKEEELHEEESEDEESDVEIILDSKKGHGLENTRDITTRTEPVKVRISSPISDKPIDFSNLKSGFTSAPTNVTREKVLPPHPSKRYSTRRVAVAPTSASTETNSSGHTRTTSEIPPSAVYAPPFTPRSILATQNNEHNETNVYGDEKQYTSTEAPIHLTAGENNGLSANLVPYSPPQTTTSPMPYVTEDNGMVYYYNPYYYYPTGETVIDGTTYAAAPQQSEVNLTGTTSPENTNGVLYSYYPVYFPQ